jgi:hypothetical protein
MAQTDWEVVSETPASAAVNTGWEVVSETPAIPVKKGQPTKESILGNKDLASVLTQLKATTPQLVPGSAMYKDNLVSIAEAEKALTKFGTPIPAVPVTAPTSWEVVSETPIAQPAAPTPQPPAPPQAAPPAPPLENMARLSAQQRQEAKKKEFSFGQEFAKGAKGAAEYGLPSVIENLKLQGSASAFMSRKKSLDLIAKIDSGEIKNFNDLKNNPIYKDLRNSGSLDIGTINAYFANRNTPEVANKLRGSIEKDFQNVGTSTANSLSILQKYAEENKAKYGPRVEKFTDIDWKSPQVVADFTNWLGNSMGAGAVQMAPVIIAAVVTKQPGLGLISGAMGVSEAVSNRVQFIRDKVKDLPPDQQGAAIAKYVADTGDASIITGLAAGSFDLLLGPAATAAKTSIKSLMEGAKGVGKVAAMKQAAKKLPKDIGGEAVTGALQETTQITAKKALEEEDKKITLKNLVDVINSSMAEGAGAPFGTAVNVAMAGALTPSAKEATPDASAPVAPAAPAPPKRVEPKLTRKKLPVSEGAEPVLAPEAQVAPVPGRVEPNLEEVQPLAEAAPTEGRVEPKLTDEALTTTALIPTVDANFAALVADFRKKGYMTDDAERLARVAFEEQADPQRVEQLRIDMVSAGENPQTAHNKAVEQAVQEALDAKQADQQGATNVARPVPDTTGVGDESAVQPTPDAATAEGLGAPKRDGVVSTEQDVGELAEGKGKPAPAIVPPPPPPPPRAKVERTQEETDAIDALNQTTSFPAATEDALDNQDNKLLNYFEKRSKLINKLDELGDQGSKLLDDLIELGSVRAASVLDETGKSVVLDENGKFDPDKRREAQKNANARLDENKKAHNAIIEQIDALDAAQNTETKGTPSGTKTVETVEAKAQEQNTPAAGVSKRGRPKAELTEEEKAEKAEERKTARREYMKGERTLPKVLGKLDKANEDIKPEDVESEADVINQSREKQGDKRDAINDLLDLEAKHRGTELGKRIKEVLNDTSRISKKELDDITKGRKVKAQERASKSNAGNVEVEAPNEGFKKDTNAVQALKRIIDTGTPFQVFLAKRLLPFVMNTKFVVVEESDPLPEQLERHKEAWGEDENRSRGVYIENRATGDKTIYVRGSSGGEYQGINPTVVLHEVLHAALQQKLSLAKLAFDRGFSGDAKLTRAYADLVKVMQNAEAEYNRLESEGKLPEGIADLKTKSEVFSNPHEFISYGMTDPAFQKFLMGAEGMKEKGEFVGERLIQPLSSLYNKFVDTMRELLGIAPDKFNALSDLIAVTNKVISSKLTPAMQMVAKSERKLASEAAKGKEEVALEAKKASKKITAIQRKIQKSKDAQETIDGIDSLIRMRDPRVFLDVLKAIWSEIGRAHV